jgi:hypothetical protein
MGVAGADQGLGGDGRHAPAAAIEHNPRVSVCRPVVQALESLVKGDEGVCLVYFAFIWDMGVDEDEILGSQHVRQGFGGYLGVCPAGHANWSAGLAARWTQSACR